MARRAQQDPEASLEALLAQSEAICSRSETVLDWAHSGRQTPPAPPDQAPRSLPAPTLPSPRSRRAPSLTTSEVRYEAELAPAVARFLGERGLTVARELCLYPTRRSRRRTVADLAGLQPDADAISRRMKLEGRRVTLAEFWPALLQTLQLAPAVPFRRGDLLERLAADPLAGDMPPARLSRYLRTLRRYGYLRRLGRATYIKRHDYVPVASPGTLAAVELKRHSFRAALAQARSYARVVDLVWVATAGPWDKRGALAQTYRRWGIGALAVDGDRVRQVLAPVPGKGRDPACAPYRRVLEERLVREQVLGRPRAFA